MIMTRLSIIHWQLCSIEKDLQKPFLIENKLKMLFAELEEIQLKLIQQVADKPSVNLASEPHTPFLSDEKVLVCTANQLLVKTEDLLARVAHICGFIDPLFRQQSKITTACGVNNFDEKTNKVASDNKLLDTKSSEIVIDGSKQSGSLKRPVELRPFRETDKAITEFFYKPHPKMLPASSPTKKVVSMGPKAISTYQLDTANSGDDLLLEILEYLSVRSRVVTMAVSKSWNNAVGPSIVYERYVPIKTFDRFGVILTNNSVLFSKMDSKQSRSITNFQLQMKQHFLPELKLVQAQIHDLNGHQADNEVIGCNCIINDSDKKRKVMSVCGGCCCLIGVGSAAITLIGAIKFATDNQSGDQDGAQIGGDMFVAGFLTGLIVAILIVLIALIRWIRHRQLNNHTDNELYQMEQEFQVTEYVVEINELGNGDNSAESSANTNQHVFRPL